VNAYRVFWIFLSVVVALFLTSCKPRSLRSNEELRLSSQELQAYKSRAENGDAAAAKKLWLHYSFGEQNRTEGTHWKAVYDEMVRKDPSKHVDD
jgi:hypothetical protein